MIKSLLFGGAAGQGIDRTAALMGKILASAGYFCFINREYSSLIRGGHNFDILTFSDQPIFSYQSKIDLLIALDENAILYHRKKLAPSGRIIGGRNLSVENIWLKADLDSFRRRYNRPVLGNNVLIGILIKYFGLPLSTAFRVVKKEFDKQEAVLVKEAIRFGYEKGSREETLPLKKRNISLLNGSAAIAKGALKAGLEIGFYYPITPATSIFDELKKMAGRKVTICQLENEIAVINATLGASFAGAMSMTATSGPGFSLMTEALSLAGMAEIPAVIYLAERYGPATGMPTQTLQGDLKFAINAGHGEFPKVVVAPGDGSEAFLRTIEAFYLAYKYRVPAIILSDKHLAESYYSFERMERPLVQAQKFLSRPTANYKNYEITKTGVSPRLVPGQGPIVRATSYEHDEDGYTTENSKIATLMTRKRWRKAVFITKEVSRLKPVEIFGRGKNLIVSWGSTKGAILEGLKTLKNCRFLQIGYLEPFPAKLVERELKRAARVILVENNVTGLLGQLIREKTGFSIKDKILKYDGRTFAVEELISQINRRI